MAKPTVNAFAQQVGRVETLVQELESVADASTRAKARELLQVLLDLHGAGLERILDRAFVAAGQTFIDDVAQDELVGNLLLLHGLHPLPLATRVEQALAGVRPYLAQHQGGVKLLGVTPEGAVHIRLEGNCHGCPSSSVTLRHTVEEALYAAAPDVTAIQVEDLVAEAGDGFISLLDGMGDQLDSGRRR